MEYDKAYFQKQLAEAEKKSAAQAPIFDGRLLDTIEALKEIIRDYEALDESGVCPDCDGTGLEFPSGGPREIVPACETCEGWG